VVVVRFDGRLCAFGRLLSSSLSQSLHSSEETKSKLQEISSQIHSMFDTLIMWVEKLSDEKLKLEGQLEEARAVRDRRYLKRPSES